MYRLGWLHLENPTFIQKNYIALVNSGYTFGAMVGSLSVGGLAKYGKWKMILYTNVLVWAAALICMIDDPYFILFGKFVAGLAAGSFSVFCPKYVAEMAPVEYRGPFGSLNQFMICFGIFIVALFGIPLPAHPNEIDNPKDSFMVA